mmetsp:Transcript_11357/g.10869  ORF Transcript_11357/g.10869 Transcript_11357/m.10869 type:complete len:232 (-) Transcript_11357:231-926(-)
MKNLGVCIICDRIEMIFNFFFCQCMKFSIDALHRGNFNLTTTKITSKNATQAHNGSSNSFIRGIFFHFSYTFFQKVHSFLLFTPARCREKGEKMTCTIYLKYLRTPFIVDSNQQANCGKWAHTGTLCIYLCNIGNSSSQNMNGNGISILELEVRCFISCALNLCFAIRHNSSNETSDLWRYVENVCHRLWVHEPIGYFLLRHNTTCILAADGYTSEARCRRRCLERVFHLV